MKIEYFNDGKRIPSLDGMRAMAIGLVVLAHVAGTTRLQHLGVFPVIANLGNVGVRLFFVISGFLITTILFRELEQQGSLSLRRFYVRRAFRIFPAFYCFLGILLFLKWVDVFSFPMGDWISAATYTINYRTQKDWNVGHCWSLAVEEQFYLLWPLLIWLLGKRRALLGAWLVVIVVPLVRYCTWKFFPEHTAGISWEFHTVCDGLATGCLLAGYRDRLAASKDYCRFRTPMFAAGLLLAVPVLISMTYDSPELSALIAPTLLNVALALVLDIVMARGDSPLGRVLNWAPVTFVGVLSYSLYLWQQPFLLHKSPHLLQRFPFNLALAVVVACASYYLVERPFLRLRRRLDARLVPQSQPKIE